MEVTEIELRMPGKDQGFLEANSVLLEQYAIKTYLDVMGGNASPETKMIAAKAALEAVGKAKPVVISAPTTQTNIQLNASFGSHITKALSGLGEALALMEMPPQIVEAEVLED